MLAKDFPELKPVIVQLEEDHQLVRALLQKLEHLLSGIAVEPIPAEAPWLRGELGGLTAILESHFSFEERKIVTALNALTAEDVTTKDLLGINV